MYKQNIYSKQQPEIVELPSSKVRGKNSSLKHFISSIAVVRFLSIIGLCLIVASIMGQLYQQLVTQERYRRLVRLLYVDAEKNLPTAYSCLMLIICCVLLAIIASFQNNKHSRYTKHWKGLSIIFFILAMDEFCSIHELATEITRKTLSTSGFFYFAWVIPGIAFLSIFILTYLKFILSLPSKTRLGFIISGVVFVFGAIGMELVGGYFFELYGPNNLIYMLVATFEEMLEMSGTIIFIYFLLDYIKTYIQSYTFLITD